MTKAPIILGKPASNLESSNFASKRVLATGALGEKKTALALEKWACSRSRDDVVIAHSLSLPGRGNGDTDHIVAVGHHILLVDSKKWKSGYSYSLTPKFEVRRSLGMKDPRGRAFKAGRVHTLAQIDKWKKELGPDYLVGGIVVIDSNVRVVRDDNWKRSPFKIASLKELPQVLDVYLGRLHDPVVPEVVEILSSRLL